MTSLKLEIKQNRKKYVHFDKLFFKTSVFLFLIGLVHSKPEKNKEHTAFKKKTTTDNAYATLTVSITYAIGLSQNASTRYKILPRPPNIVVIELAISRIFELKMTIHMPEPFFVMISWEKMSKGHKSCDLPPCHNVLNSKSVYVKV